MKELRVWLHEQLNYGMHHDGAARWFDIGFIVLVTLNVVAVTLETVDWMYEAYGPLFDAFEIFSVIIFTIEYVVRLWICSENSRFSNGWKGRLKYALTPMAIIDLLAILPFYLWAIIGADLRFLRALRLLRVFKLTRYYPAMNMLLDVIQEEISALLAGFFILLILLILASSGAYLFEHEIQPDAFGSVPQAMWWALVTLTTVGYGDVTPITTEGKIFGGLITIIGIGMAALPAGILASGLAEHMRRRRDDIRHRIRQCLADGTIDAADEAAIEDLRKRLGVQKNIVMQIQEEVVAQNLPVHTCSCPHCGLEFTPPR